MATYQPGNYLITVVATLPAKTARQLHNPERFQYSGDVATVTFGPMPIRAQKPTTGKDLAARFVKFCMAEHPKAKYTITDFTIKPDVG
ncbi:hypothetical protein ACIP69_18335 [Streptomyces hygroscopicus]|uniref:hypothetical protein n=1 Tax=Streptomyces hygroscopicus TaxID=1912 RepID=UPI0038141452